MNSLSIYISWKRSIKTVLLIATMEFFNNSVKKIWVNPAAINSRTGFVALVNKLNAGNVIQQSSLVLI